MTEASLILKPDRSLRFQPETPFQDFFQPAMQVNHPNDNDFMRMVKMKTPLVRLIPVNTIVREYRQDFFPGQREPYYPIPFKCQNILSKVR
jgi:UDP-galactopyranose mutase